ncbi:MAG: hypothetical protein UDB11_05950 [Peptococcaceae bacterium]|nr:hypothetical protein [Peptococcaceae bacterium]
MTNAKLNVLLATALDKAADNRAQADRIMKRFALAQALAVEEQLSDDDTRIVAAATALYDLNDDQVNPHDNEGDAFKPIVITGYIKDLLDDANLPVFEASAVGSLIAMQKHGTAIENNLHRLLLDINTLATLDEPQTTVEEAKAAMETLTHASAKRRLALLFGLDEQ